METKRSPGKQVTAQTITMSKISADDFRSNPYYGWRRLIFKYKIKHNYG